MYGLQDVPVREETVVSDAFGDLVDGSGKCGQGLRIFDKRPQHHPCLRMDRPTQPTNADLHRVDERNATQRFDYWRKFFWGYTTDKFKCDMKILWWHPA